MVVKIICAVAICALVFSLQNTQSSLAGKNEETERGTNSIALAATQASATPLKLFDGDLSSGNLQIYGRINGFVMFSAPQNSSFGVWSTTGDPGITATKVFEGFVQNAAQLNENLIFFSSPALLKTDGTLTGTQEITSGIQGFNEPVALNDAILFSNGGFNGGLWRTDGTLTGTQEITPLDFSSSGFLPYAWNGKAYFFANDGNSGVELWKSDGTLTGTVLVSDTYAGTGGADFGMAGHEIGQELLYYVFKSFVWSLWATDGTASGTRFIKDIPFPPLAFTKSGNTVYFIVQPVPNTGFLGLWKTDGTANGTVAVGSTDPSFSGVPQLGDGTPRLFAGIGNGSLLFRGRNVPSGNELWKTDGTISNTQILTDINMGGDHSSPFMLSTGHRVFLGADDGVHGIELWTSDGTANGTSLVADLVPGITSSLYSFVKMKYSDGLFLFQAYDEQNREQLWMLQAAPLITSTLPLSTTESGKPYSHTFAAQGWPAPTFEVLSGTLPPGIQLLSTGTLTGTPNAPGTYTITISASNGSLPNATQSFVIQVASSATPTPTPTPTSTPSPTVTPMPTATVNPMRPRAYLPFVKR
jgi:ELWxxDGT repeat protein